MIYKLNTTYHLHENREGKISENKVKITLENNHLIFHYEIVDKCIYNPLTKDNDDLYDYDVVEVFISFKERKDEYFEYELSPFGVRFKGLIINKTLKDPTLTRVEPDFEYEVNKTETGYNAIISIDVSKINNFDINKIYFNCFTIDVDGQSDYQNLYALNPTLSNTFHLSSFLSKLEK